MTQLLTVAEFKDRFKISHSAFYREVAANRIPIRKIGRATRIAVADAEAWAASLPTQGGEASNG
ncbi:helix-turn-helix domain-containing protein [Erythrobacter tepidarius]|uniref:helix-turn-helix domain-containing protein n=1 Tax=Erythrobacter tepidarius TaxID=60454 RepID=UPI000A3D3A53|nr:helix-turn-helix domain-containing protein [Erythrobacter tepidarius]MBA4044756.1 DNA-binding protein [Erythrobacter sp.]